MSSFDTNDSIRVTIAVRYLLIKCTISVA